MLPPIDDSAAAALLALESAPAAEVVSTLRDVLRTRYGARSTRVMLVDYRLTVLQSVPGSDPATPERRPVEGSREGRAFTTGAASVTERGDRFEVLLPVSVRNDRLGVLAVELDERPAGEVVDSLAAVARALGHAIAVAARHTDVFEQAARVQRLSLAAELQWQNLPGRGTAGPDFDLAGQLEPAYHVAGDAFDWSVAPDHVSLSVHEGTGDGTVSAQVTNLALTALRNARRAGMGPAGQADMAGDAVHRFYGGHRHVETVLLRIDRRHGEVIAVDAGSPIILRQHDDSIEPVRLAKQLPLGRFGETRYREQQFRIGAGDRLIILSDGVHDARPTGGERFGDARLAGTLRSAVPRSSHQA